MPFRNIFTQLSLLSLFILLTQILLISLNHNNDDGVMIKQILSDDLYNKQQRNIIIFTFNKLTIAACYCICKI